MTNLAEITPYASYDDTKPIRVWFGNLAKYNEGMLVGNWLSLPMEEEELKIATDAILGKDEEYQLNDWECDFKDIVHQWSDVFELNKIAEKLESLDDYDKERIGFLLSHIGLDFDEALENYEDVIAYEGELSDVAYELVQDGCFGDIPKSISHYIDYELIGRDLSYDGYYEDRSKNKVFFYV